MNATLRFHGSWWIAVVTLLTVVGAAAAPAPAKSKAGPAASPQLASCAWDRPGHDPYMGDVVAAVDRYPDMPAPVRERLKQRMAARQYDDIAEISRDHIEGRSSYGPAITDMHFGTGRICKTVTRTSWKDDMRERGLVYCDGDDCIIVPTVCRNVSRVSRVAAGPALAAGDPPFPFDPPGAGLPPGLATGAPFGAESPFAFGPDTPLAFEAPQAGNDPFYGGTPIFGGARPTTLIISSPGTPASQSAGPGGAAGGGPVVIGGTPVVTGAVPEPSTWGLMLVGGALVAVARRRRIAATPRATA